LRTPLKPTLPASARATGGVRIPSHERVVLGNGLTLVIVPHRDVPLIAFQAVIRGGTLGDPRGKSGVASLVANLLEKGAGDRNAYEFADAVEGAGGSFSAFAGAEAISLSGQFLARDQALAVTLLADALLRPHLVGEEFAKLRVRQIELIKAAKDSDPSELIGTYGRAVLFGEHPYSRPVMGSERSLAAIDEADIRAYYRAQFGADRITLVFAGDVDVDALTQAVTVAFGGAPAAQSELPQIAPAARQSGRRVFLIDSPESEQAHFWIGNVGVSKHYAPRAALELVNTLYGGRFTSILNTELRIRTGLSYGARSGFTRSSTPGEFAIRSFTQAESLGQALNLSIDSLAALKRDGVTAEMLDSARAYVLGQYPLGFETAADWAAAMAELEFYRLDAGYIEQYGVELCAVSPQEARVAIDEAFPGSDDLAIVLIGPAAHLREPAQRFGAVTEWPLKRPDFAPPRRQR
jgi:zinc protease